MGIIIKAENIGKKYIIEHQKRGQYLTIRDTIMHRIRGIEQRILHPLSPNKEIVTLEEFWALKDINFEIEQGDRVGIIGRNGAGKSTLLKILSRITEPTTGKIRLKGRVASLLEVGTGFHPELTGMENIFLNGAVLGMIRAEIKRKFDEIVAFAEIEKFLDTPVKHYSSGMYVRLAFAVAAHLEPEILIIDEVLAVGDAQFQKKCLGKMEEVGREGRTVLFVSHNMATIQQLTTWAILLDKGIIVENAKTRICIEKYLSFNSCRNESCEIKTNDNEFIIKSIRFRGDLLEPGFNKELNFDLHLELKGEKDNINLSFGIYHTIGARLATSKVIVSLGKGLFSLDISIKDHHLPPGTYYLSLGIEAYGQMIFYGENILSFDITDEVINDPLLIPYLKNKRDKLGAFIPVNLNNIRLIKDENGI